MNLINGDCLIELKNIPDKSVDLIFCDPPYCQTECKWDKPIDLKGLFKELYRVAKDECPIIFTCTTKFGYELINAGGIKRFRYDMVWVKNRTSNPFLSGVMPMKKHEMVYVFYKKCPKIYRKLKNKYHAVFKNKKPETENLEGELEETDHGHNVISNTLGKPNKSVHYKYHTPLPSSVLEEEELEVIPYNRNKDLKGTIPIKKEKKIEYKYHTPLPSSVLEEGELEELPPHNKKTGLRSNKQDNTFSGNGIKDKKYKYHTALPSSVLKGIKHHNNKLLNSTQKPVELVEFFLKYYTLEGWTVLDPTMGSGTTGVACKKMKRNFIGIEKDEEMFKKAKKRIANKY
jgi:DNA modification methylase